MVPTNEPGVPRVIGYVQVCMADEEFDSFRVAVSLILAPTPCLAAIHRFCYACVGASLVRIAVFARVVRVHPVQWQNAKYVCPSKCCKFDRPDLECVQATYCLHLSVYC